MSNSSGELQLTIPDDPDSTTILSVGSLSSSTSEEEADRNKIVLEYELLRAARTNELTKLERALQEANRLGFSVDVLVYNTLAAITENTLIHIATRYRSVDVVKMLAENYPEFLAKTNTDGDTALHLAIKAGDDKALEAFIDILQTSFPNGRPDYSDPDQICGAVSMLGKTNAQGNTVLHESLIHGRKEMAEQLVVLVDKSVFFDLNNQEKSALYLAVVAGNKECVRVMVTDDDTSYEKLKGESVIHAAVRAEQKDILHLLSSKLPKLLHLQDKKGRNPLHVAAAKGFLSIVTHFVFCGYNYKVINQPDEDGMLPIHFAAMNGQISVMKMLIQSYHDPCDLITPLRKTVLHIAAENGRRNTVRYILQSPELSLLINQSDINGNTALHLASINSRWRVLRCLVLDKRVDRKSLNNDCCTANDAALAMEGEVTWTMMKTRSALEYHKIPKFKSSSFQLTTKNMADDKETVNSMMIVSALIATVTFAAGFTMPGGFNSSGDSDPGMALNLKHSAFQIFVVSNTVAMYTSTMATILLIVAVTDRVSHTMPLAGILGLVVVSLAALCLAFMTGVYVVVNTLHWVAYLVLVIGCVYMFFVIILSYKAAFELADVDRTYHMSKSDRHRSSKRRPTAEICEI